MNPKTLSRFLIISLLATVAGIYASAQDKPPGPPDNGQNAPAGPPRRPDLLQALGLTTDQLQQIRRINRERKPRMDEAMQHLREANRSLDQAIYADNVDENDVQLRLREFNAAQAEVARLRFVGELQIRRVLTPDQLVRFRDLRAKFAARMDAQRQNRRLNRRPPGDGTPPPPDQSNPN